MTLCICSVLLVVLGAYAILLSWPFQHQYALIYKAFYVRKVPIWSLGSEKTQVGSVIVNYKLLAIVALLPWEWYVSLAGCYCFLPLV